MTITTDLVAAKALLSADAAVMHAVVTGPASGGSSLVDVGGGLMVRTLARASAEMAAFTSGFTMTGDILFTDALYDIGKSGATRPRDGFFSRNLVASANIMGGDRFYPTGSTLSFLRSPADGNLTLYNNAANAFGLLQFGGTTSSFPAWKRSATALQARLADDSAYTDLYVKNLLLDTAAGLFFASRGDFRASSDGVFLLKDNAGTSFGRLQFGGTTSSFPALARSGPILTAVLADASGYADFYANNIVIPAAAGFYFLTRSKIVSPADGILLLQNNAATDFTRLQLGGTTSSFPALRRINAGLESVLADASAYATFMARELHLPENSAGAPTASANVAKLYVDPADGDLKVIFGDGTIKTISTDT